MEVIINLLKTLAIMLGILLLASLFLTIVAWIFITLGKWIIIGFVGSLVLMMCWWIASMFFEKD